MIGIRFFEDKSFYVEIDGLKMATSYDDLSDAKSQLLELVESEFDKEIVRMSTEWSKIKEHRF